MNQHLAPQFGRRIKTIAATRKSNIANDTTDPKVECRGDINTTDGVTFATCKTTNMLASIV